MDNKILTKINKLLALSESPNEHEATSALLKAQELLAKHNLTMDDVIGADDMEDKVMFGSVSTDYTEEPWRLRLATVIADNFRCYALGRRVNSSIVFLGKETDISICKSLYTYTSNFIEVTCCNLLSYGVFDTRDYANGFIEGTNEKFKEQCKRNKWELALCKPKEVESEYNKLVTSVKKKPIVTHVKSVAYQKGFLDGKYFSQTGIENKESTETMMHITRYNTVLLSIYNTLKNVPWIECFRRYPSYTTKYELVNHLYNISKTMLEEMLNIVETLKTTEGDRELVKKYRNLAGHSQDAIMSFYRAYNTPQDHLNIKTEYETKFREALSQIKTYVEEIN